MSDGASRGNFGCEHCWPSAAGAAWEARGTHTRVAELIDESHFHVMILACPHCAQPFISVFTEMIDWKDGDDPQYWSLLPITRAEATDLTQRGDSLTEPRLNQLGPGRRCLQCAHPKGVEEHVFWSTGISVGPHD